MYMHSFNTFLFSIKSNKNCFNNDTLCDKMLRISVHSDLSCISHVLSENVCFVNHNVHSKIKIISTFYFIKKTINLYMSLRYHKPADYLIHASMLHCASFSNVQCEDV